MNKQACPFNDFFLGSAIFFCGKLVPSHRDSLAYGCLLLCDYPIILPSHHFKSGAIHHLSHSPRKQPTFTMPPQF